MGFAAALMVIPGTPAAGGDLLDPGAAAVGAATAVLSSVIPYSLELEALRRIAVGTFGVLMSLEPAVAALIGLVALDQGLAAIEVLGIAWSWWPARACSGGGRDGRRRRREQPDRVVAARPLTARRAAGDAGEAGRAGGAGGARPGADSPEGTVGSPLDIARRGSPSNDGMWRSIWASRQTRHEHSGTDMPVFEQTVIPSSLSRSAAQ